MDFAAAAEEVKEVEKKAVEEASYYLIEFHKCFVGGEETCWASADMSSEYEE